MSKQYALFNIYNVLDPRYVHSNTDAGSEGDDEPVVEEDLAVLVASLRAELDEAKAEIAQLKATAFLILE